MPGKSIEDAAVQSFATETIWTIAAQTILFLRGGDEPDLICRTDLLNGQHVRPDLLGR